MKQALNFATYNYNMMRLIFSCICIISLTVISCNNDKVKKDAQVPEQEKQLRELISKYPDSVLLKENLVQYFRDNGKYNLAIRETENALKKDSLNDRLLDMNATLHFENGDTLTAIKTFEKAISIKPLPQYILSLGSLYAATKNPLAFEMADALLQTRNADAQKQSLFIKGLYLSNIGEKVKAISFFNACLKIDYRYLLAYREKAICLYDLGKYATALDELKKAVAVQNTFDEGYFWMGRCYEKLGKKQEAIDSYQLALQIDPDYVEAKEALKKIS